MTEPVTWRKRMPIRIDVSAISSRLQAIREAVGAEKTDFRPSRSLIVDVETPHDEVRGLLDEGSKLLLKDGRPCFAYIRDHTEKALEDWRGADGMKRLHFANCKTLRGMEAQGRFARYRVTNATWDRYAVDVASSSGDVEENVQLYPCHYCLLIVNFRGYRKAYRDAKRKMAIVRAFSAKEAMDDLWQDFDVFRQAVSDLKSAHGPTGYTNDWPEVSLEVRRQNDWLCDECSVDLSGARHLLHVHHVNGDKRNNSNENLRCLCKECHSKEPNHHYIVLSEEDLQTINRARGQLF